MAPALTDKELAMLHFYTNEKVAKAKCMRCGKEAQGRCSMYKEVKYYEACQRLLAWTKRKVCGEITEDVGDVQSQ